MDDESAKTALADELVHVFKRLAEGDLSARVPRNFRRDSEDAIAFFVGVFAEQLQERYGRYREYEEAVAGLIEKFIAVAAGDFNTRAERTYRGDPVDTLAFLLNNVAAEVGELVGDHDRQRMLLETVIESMLDGVLMLDPRGRIRRSNAAMARLLGQTPASLLGLHVSAILAPAEHDLVSHLDAQLTNGLFENRDTQFCARDGSTLTMAVNASPHRDVDGLLVGIVLVVRDDRELKNARAHVELTDRLATMGTLAAGVAHEINNPLAFISANVDFVIEELEDADESSPISNERLAEVLKALRSSRTGAERVRQIVQELRGFTRTDPDRVGPVDLNALLDSALGFAGNEIRHRARLVRQYGAQPLVLANEGRLMQALLNLLQNAAQSIPVGAAGKNEIRIVTGETGDHAFAEVHDTGCGIAEENLSRIFDLFFTTKPFGDGVGLGLSIALRLIEKAGGSLDVKSQVGAGSMFRVVLPLAPSGSSRQELPRAPTKRSKTRTLDILVVDDEVEVGHSVRRILISEHRVDVVASAREALEMFAIGTYDVILCDLLMPDMNGIELHAQVLDVSPNAARRMAFMTGGEFSQDAVEFLARTRSLSFDKPFDAKSLRAIVARMRRRR